MEALLKAVAPRPTLSLVALLSLAAGCGEPGGSVPATKSAPVAGVDGRDRDPVGERAGHPTGVEASAALGSIAFCVTGIEGSTGAVVVRLFRGPEGFPGDADASFRSLTVAIEDGEATGMFHGVPHGEYALWACHDEDADGELDTNFIGMPKEGVGVSGPPPSFLPTFDG
ncbi:MAG: DUF2141 domain-containing protein, partial [Planctomycetota bacterium]|nr:DUF2141 domain-containing protein [Planctomycetota bacterium]